MIVFAAFWLAFMLWEDWGLSLIHIFMLQGTVIPAFEVERRICHNVIEEQSLVQIVQKAGITGFAKVMADAAQGKVHFGKAIGRRLFFLSIQDVYKRQNEGIAMAE